MPAAPKPDKPKATPAKAKSGKVGKKAKGKKPAKINLEYSIDCTHPVEDGIMDLADFEKYLNQKIKIDGKCNRLKKRVIVTKTKNKLIVKAVIAFKKRSLRYLTKKYLKKHSLRDWLRPVASDKATYELRYYQINNEEEEAEDDE